MPNYGMPEIDQAYREGGQMLATNADDQALMLSKLMGRYNVNDPQSYARGLEMQDAGRRAALFSLKARLGEQDLRHELWKRRMDSFWEQLRREKKYGKWAERDQKLAMVMQALSSVGQIAAPLPIWGQKTEAPPFDPYAQPRLSDVSFQAQNRYGLSSYPQHYGP